MLAIRFQRTGRRGHAQFRIIVQDARLSPTSGKVVAYLGSYNPHTKTVALDKAQAQTFLTNGAQPSPRAARLLKAEGVKLPKWVASAPKKKLTTRNPEKLRRNRPAGTEAPQKVEEAPAEKVEAEAPAEQTAEPETAQAAEVAQETAPPAEEAAAETTAEDTAETA